MEPKIIFEDEHIVVLDKPSGLQVIPVATNKDRKTLTDWLEPRWLIQNNDMLIFK